MTLLFSHIDRGPNGERATVFKEKGEDAPIRLGREFFDVAHQLSQEEAQRAKDVLAITEAAHAGFSAIAPRDTDNKTLKAYAYGVIGNFIDTDADVSCTVKTLGPDLALFFESSEHGGVLSVGIREGKGGRVLGGLVFMEANETSGLPSPLIVAGDHTAQENRTYQLDEAADAMERFFETVAAKASPKARAWLLNRFRENLPPAPQGNLSPGPDSALG